MTAFTLEIMRESPGDKNPSGLTAMLEALLLKPVSSSDCGGARRV